MADFEKIEKTADKLSRFSLPAYDSLPEIELYMDQLVGYLNKLLLDTCRSEDGEPLTPNRVNNYVKDGRIERPVQKKYDRDKIAMLYMLCCAKQNLMLPEASALLSALGDSDVMGLYERFRALQEPIVKSCAEELSGCVKSDEAMLEKALELTLRSTAERYVAEEIIASVCGDVAPVKAQKEKKRKNKKHKQ